MVGVLAGPVQVVALAGDCKANKCQNGASCQKNLTTTAPNYYCVCPAGYIGGLCETNVDECKVTTANGTFSVCQNKGECTDKVNGFSCACRHGFSGKTCAIRDYWTLQQWTGNDCIGGPWRCFKLQMDKCIDTGFADGNIPNKKNWYGRLKYDNNSYKYSVDLCWGKKDDEEESCNCDNHYTKVPRLGKNSLGPVSKPGVKDSDRCHKLMRVTSSRLVNSTGKNLDASENGQNMDCSASDDAVRTQGMLSMASVLVALALSALTAL